MYVTSCRLIGSLKAVSMMFFVGTIFHVGIQPESFVKMVVTIGGGFNFSEIWKFRVKGIRSHYIWIAKESDIQDPFEALMVTINVSK